MSEHLPECEGRGRIVPCGSSGAHTGMDVYHPDGDWVKGECICAELRACTARVIEVGHPDTDEAYDRALDDAIAAVEREPWTSRHQSYTTGHTTSSVSREGTILTLQAMKRGQRHG